MMADRTFLQVTPSDGVRGPYNCDGMLMPTLGLDAAGRRPWRIRSRTEAGTLPAQRSRQLSPTRPLLSDIDRDGFAAG